MTPDNITTDNPGTLAKTFDPAGIEARWYAHWEDNGLFRPARPDAQPFTIVNPPPNVTGSLHIGHALDNTLQDVVVRYERLRGKDALWVVGTDHAGIATQMVVERQLEAQQDKRTNYSREEFIAKVWEWKHESGGTITGQLRRLGCSMDWSREQFTMDPHFSRAVTKVFVDLYNDGLIYRDKRLVNWDPGLKTAISDLEVETRDIAGKFWHLRYPLADGVRLDDGSDHLVVATTRPETMLADMAVAVNAKDARYQSVIGKFVELPITGRRVPIVADDHADPELGSGAVKITPGHDFNDFEVGKRAGIAPADMLNMLDQNGDVNQVMALENQIPTEFLRLHRFRRDGIDGARELVVKRLEEQGHLVPYIDKDGVEHEYEPRVIATPFGDRSGAVIEPWLTDQWYVNAEVLAKPPLEAVRSGAIEIIPKNWEKTFFNWMENIQPWCVSRQLWWGHRIPVAYGPKRNGQTVDHIFHLGGGDCKIFCAASEGGILDQAKAYYAGIDREVVLTERWDEGWNQEAKWGNDREPRTKIYVNKDQDVLDTWFSSALWPFATLGWPETSQPNPARPEPVEGLSFSSGHTQDAEEKGSASTSSARAGLGMEAGFKGEEQSLLARHYPNDLLISGFDILFFWDARMAMMGMKLNADENGRGQVPWKRLYLHGLVRAGDGQKMSKSKGNVVDPLLLIDKFGADALRFFMAAMESQGRDIKIDEKRVEGYRNFATKLWNAARFCQGNGIAASQTLAAPAANSAVNRWIIGEVVETVAALDRAMADLRFDAAANTIYHFVWDTFCDWYIELIKGSFDEETRAVAGWVLDQILVMLHPFMPFITEELWHAQGERPYELIVAKWPEPGAAVDCEAKASIDLVIEAVREVRSARTEMNIPPGTRMECWVVPASDSTMQRLKNNWTAISKLARVDLSDLPSKELGKSNTVQVTVADTTIALQLEGVIDIAAEQARLAKALAASEKERDSLAKRLENPAFAQKAKPEAVEKARGDHAHHAAEAERLTAALARLG